VVKEIRYTKRQGWYIVIVVYTDRPDDVYTYDNADDAMIVLDSLMAQYPTVPVKGVNRG
jgi:hypothetical protein